MSFLKTTLIVALTIFSFSKVQAADDRVFDVSLIDADSKLGIQVVDNRSASDKGKYERLLVRYSIIVDGKEGKVNISEGTLNLLPSKNGDTFITSHSYNNITELLLTTSAEEVRVDYKIQVLSFEVANPIEHEGFYRLYFESSS